jgi:hypothetical protein
MKAKQLEKYLPYVPLALLGIITGVLAWSYWHVFAGEPCGDDNTHHFVEIVRLSEMMKHGDWSWWNPSSNAGFASGYYYQVLPQAVPAAMAAYLGFEPLTAFQICLYIPSVLQSAAAYRALRLMGASPWMAVGAAAMVPFALGDDMASQGGNWEQRWGQGVDGTFWEGLYTQLWAGTAFPIALAYGVRWIDQGKSLAPAIAWGAFVFLCHPFIGVALGVALAVGTAVVMVLAAIREKKLWWPAAARLSGLGVALMLAAATVWLPVIVHYDGFGAFPHRVIDEIGPGFVRMGHWLVTGKIIDAARKVPLMTMLLPLVAVFARGRWFAWLWAAAIIYVLLLCLGPNVSQIGGGGEDILPAARFLPTLQIMFALIAGAGLGSMLERAWVQPWDPALSRLLPCLAAAAVTTFIVVAGAGTNKASVRVASDFGDGIDVEDMHALMPAIRALPPGRIQARAGAGSHWAVSLPTAYADRDAFLVMGGAALQSSPNYYAAWELRDEDPVRAAWIFDAPYVFMKTENSAKIPGEIVAQGVTYEVHKLDSEGLVSPIQVIGALPAGREPEREMAKKWIWSNDAMKDRYLAHHGDGGEEPGPEPHGKTLDVSRTFSHIVANVEVDAGDQPTTFVIRESWHPGWHASIDGADVHIRRVSPDFMAVDVPPGAHRIDLQFERPLWTWLLWLLWPACVIAGWQLTVRVLEAGSRRLRGVVEALA